MPDFIEEREDFLFDIDQPPLVFGKNAAEVAKTEAGLPTLDGRKFRVKIEGRTYEDKYIMTIRLFKAEVSGDYATKLGLSFGMGTLPEFLDCLEEVLMDSAGVVPGSDRGQILQDYVDYICNKSPCPNCVKEVEASVEDHFTEKTYRNLDSVKNSNMVLAHDSFFRKHSRLVQYMSNIRYIADTVGNALLSEKENRPPSPPIDDDLIPSQSQSPTPKTPKKKKPLQEHNDLISSQSPAPKRNKPLQEQQQQQQQVKQEQQASQE